MSNSMGRVNQQRRPRSDCEDSEGDREDTYLSLRQDSALYEVQDSRDSNVLYANFGAGVAQKKPPEDDYTNTGRVHNKEDTDTAFKTNFSKKVHLLSPPVQALGATGSQQSLHPFATPVPPKAATLLPMQPHPSTRCSCLHNKKLVVVFMFMLCVVLLGGMLYFIITCPRVGTHESDQFISCPKIIKCYSDTEYPCQGYSNQSLNTPAGYCNCTNYYMDQLCSIRHIGPIAGNIPVRFNDSNLYWAQGFPSQLSGFTTDGKLEALQLQYGSGAEKHAGTHVNVHGIVDNPSINDNETINSSVSLGQAEMITRVTTWTKVHANSSMEIRILRRIAFETSEMRVVEFGKIDSYPRTEVEATPNNIGALVFMSGNADGLSFYFNDSFPIS